MRLLVDRSRFEGHSDSSSRSRSPTVSDDRSPSEEMTLPSIHLLTLLPPSEASNAPSSPCSTIAPPTISRSICIDMFVIDEDWRHHARASPSIFFDLDDPSIFHNSVADCTLTVKQSEVQLSPEVTVRAFDLDRSARYSVGFSVYCNAVPLYSESLEAFSTQDCCLTSPLAPDHWPLIVANISNAHEFTILQSIVPLDSPSSARIDVFYSIRTRYQAISASPISSPETCSPYDAAQNFGDFAPYGHAVASPTSSPEFLAISSPDASFSACPSAQPSNSYSVRPEAPHCNTDLYAGEPWSYSAALQLRFQAPYSHHYPL